ncbi:MAG: DUF4234 domain-containing protein [Schwartzia sp.]|nr:DUF4234 domain-containing protein [Schwartzia sp. (in: firmicutes)]
MEYHWEKRGIVKAVVFSFITCGIYGIYWMYALTNECHEAAGRQTTASGGMACIYTFVTCGIYYFYWLYKMGATLSEAKRNRGIYVDGDDSIMYLLFAFFGLAIVSEALIQSTLNDLYDFDEAVARGENLPTAQG